MTRAVFLDRDGVLNRAHIRDGIARPPQTVEELEILPSVGDACRMLRADGYELIVVTNQPDVARGTQERAVVEQINDALRTSLPLNDVRVCFHDDGDGCDCRKPEPGLILQAARDRGIDLADSWMVGDRWTDVEAGRRAGCKTVAVTGPTGPLANGGADVTAASLREAAEIIVRSSTEEFDGRADGERTG